MEFNKILRGAERAQNNEKSIYDILDASFLCHIAFQHQGVTMMIPTAYGRRGNSIYFHGSSKNHMLNQVIKGDSICIGVTLLDGIVLARSLFETSANYRSAVLFGKAELITNQDEKIEGLKIISENIIKGRWNEVSIGSESQLKATMVVKFTIEKASAKTREGGPEGDEDLTQEVWSGHIPLSLKATKPVMDTKFGIELEMSESIKNFWKKNT